MSDNLPLEPPRARRVPMIKNLMPSLPERGKIKIGEKGEERKTAKGNTFQLPKKLDHFLVTTLQRGKDNNFIKDPAFHDRYGEAPTEIPVRLLFDDAVLNFPTRYACFIGRTLWCSGDGETAHRLSERPQDAQNADAIRPHEVRCPCFRQDPGYSGRDRCKMNGSLGVLIEGMGGVGGVWKFRTTSYNSITGLMSSMAFLRSVTGGILANIPLKLRVSPKQVTSPTDGAQQTVYIVTLEFEGDITQLQEIGHDIALDRAKTHVSIANIESEARRLLELPPPPNAPLPGDDGRDIVDEFYPEQVDGSAAPPRPSREQFSEQAKQAQPDKPPEEDKVQSEEPEPFEIVNLDGEVFMCPPDRAIEGFKQTLMDAHQRAALQGLEGVWQSNEAFLAAVGERIDLETGTGLVQFYSERREALLGNKKSAPKGQEAPQGGTVVIDPKVEGGEKRPDPEPILARQAAMQEQREDSARPTQGRTDAASAATAPAPTAGSTAPTDAGSASSPDGRGQTAPTSASPSERAPAHGTPPPRSEFWAQESYTIERPLKRDQSVNFQVLRDTLMQHAHHAASVEDIDKLKSDNESHLRSLGDAYPKYREQVEAIFRTSREKLEEAR